MTVHNHPLRRLWRAKGGDSQPWCCARGNQGSLFRKYTTSGKEHGTGLGTYSAAMIARTLGGDITFATSEEAGTSVFVTLPRSDDETESEVQTGTAAEAPQAAPADQGTQAEAAAPARANRKN